MNVNVASILHYRTTDYVKYVNLAIVVVKRAGKEFKNLYYYSKERVETPARFRLASVRIDEESVIQTKGVIRYVFDRGLYAEPLIHDIDSGH